MTLQSALQQEGDSLVQTYGTLFLIRESGQGPARHQGLAIGPDGSYEA